MRPSTVICDGETRRDRLSQSDVEHGGVGSETRS